MCNISASDMKTHWISCWEVNSGLLFTPHKAYQQWHKKNELTTASEKNTGRYFDALSRTNVKISRYLEACTVAKSFRSSVLAAHHICTVHLMGCGANMGMCTKNNPTALVDTGPHDHRNVHPKTHAVNHLNGRLDGGIRS